ncbi:MAG: hypothetical protein GY953_10295, partial [bacterium]|nr:hypothetical protein [bacterium]
MRGALLVLRFVALLPAQDRTFRSNAFATIGPEVERTASVRLGDLDVVLANGRHWPQQNRIFLNSGRGPLTVSRDLGRERSTSYATELADLDGDGDLD